MRIALKITVHTLCKEGSVCLPRIVRIKDNARAEAGLRDLVSPMATY